tara:strand:- start:8622 stop:9425 length:804 start_codon:yes stop_codon:yes gene_type:complete
MTPAQANNSVEEEDGVCGDVYLIGAAWPTGKLTDEGKWSKRCKVGSGMNHTGLLFTKIQAGVRKQFQSDRNGEEVLWRRDYFYDESVEDITWDYQFSKRPKFQRHNSPYYRGATMVSLQKLKLNKGQKGKLIDACMKITRMNPGNHFIYRFDALFEVLPWRCFYFHCDRSVPVPASCAGSTLMALAMITNPEAYKSDRAVFVEMGMPYGGCCGRWFLTQLTPSQTFRAVTTNKLLSEGSQVNGIGRVGRVRRDNNTDDRVPLLTLAI